MIDELMQVSVQEWRKCWSGWRSWQESRKMQGIGRPGDGLAQERDETAAP